MKTADQTLLARMGFSDPDKKSAEHDAACRYVCEPATVARICPGLAVTHLRTKIEAPIIKGARQFMQYVGFVDATWTVGGTNLHTNQQTSPVHVCLEVKITETPFGDVLRQLHFYQAYGDWVQGPWYNSERPFRLPVHRWLLVTRYAMSEADVAKLQETGIEHVRLGVGFDEYLKTLTASPPSKSREI